MKNKEYAEALKVEGFPLTAQYINAIFKEARELSYKYQVRQDYEDFCQLAVVEATRLEPFFDKDKGRTFMSFIRKPIKQVAQKVYGYSRSSTNKFNKIAKFMSNYLKENDKIPSVAIMAKALSVTEWYIKSIYYGKPIKVPIDSVGEELLSTTPNEVEDNQLAEMLGSLDDATGSLIYAFYIDELTLDELSIILNKSKQDLTAIIDEAINNLKDNYNDG